MDAKQAAIYGIFSGMDVLSSEAEFINSAKVDFFAKKILAELGHPLPSDKEVDDFNIFINQVNDLCQDILLK